MSFSSPQNILLSQNTVHLTGYSTSTRSKSPTIPPPRHSRCAMAQRPDPAPERLEHGNLSARIIRSSYCLVGSDRCSPDLCETNPKRSKMSSFCSDLLENHYNLTRSTNQQLTEALTEACFYPFTQVLTEGWVYCDDSLQVNVFMLGSKTSASSTASVS